MPAGLKYLCLCGWEVTVEKRRWWRRGWCCRWYNKILDRNHRGKSNQIEREMTNWADNEEVKGVRVRGAGNHIMMGRTHWPIVPWCGRRWCYSSCPGLRASSSAVCVFVLWLVGWLSAHLLCYHWQSQWGTISAVGGGRNQSLSLWVYVKSWCDGDGQGELFPFVSQSVSRQGGRQRRANEYCTPAAASSAMFTWIDWQKL